MDLATENRIAAILMKEAAEMRRQAEQEGVLAYLKRPSVRIRPNSRFLASTVLGVEQANRAVEINEMWRVREKELELENRSKGRSRYDNDHVSRHGGSRDSSTSRSHRHDNSRHRHSDVPSLSSRNKDGDRVRPDDAGLRNDEGLQDDGGLRDDEVELFLRSRVKRGRGSIGSRMDETGPFISQSSDFHDDDRVETSDYAGVERWGRTTIGPERPSRKSKESSEDDESGEEHGRRKRSKKTCSKKPHSKKHSSKEKTRDKKKRSRHEKRHK